MHRRSQTTFEKKNIVVTGGAGFLGSHLCEELLRQHRVICLDNFLTGSEENIHHLVANPDFKFLRHDITQPVDFSRSPELQPFRISFQGIQEVYHLASPSSPKDYTAYPIETLLANAEGTKHALDLAETFGAKFLQLSSSAIYGDHDEKPLTETSWGVVDPVGPRSCYEEGKRYAETLAHYYHEVRKVDVKIARVFNTYGPRMKLTDGRMIPDFVQSALSGAPLEIIGSDTGLTSLQYVTDVIEAVMKLMASDEHGPFNIGNPETTTMREVAELVVQLTGTTSKIVTKPPLPTSKQQAIPDIAAIKDALGWFPVVPLEDGLRKTIAYMQGSRVMRYAA